MKPDEVAACWREDVFLFTAHLAVLKYIQLFSVAFVFTYLKTH
jgi:hypothetical protein